MLDHQIVALSGIQVGTVVKRVILAAIVALSANVTATGEQIDQQYVPPTINGYGIVGAAQRVDTAQTFTVGITGLLSAVDVWVTRHETVSQPLLFDIRRTLGGIPVDVDSGPGILASGAVAAQLVAVSRPFDPPSGVTSDSRIIDLNGPYLAPEALVHVDLRTFGISVSESEVLAIVLRSDDPNEFRGYTYAWHGKSPGQYHRGAEYSRSTVDNIWYTLDIVESLSFDHAFRTYVDVIPEPKTAMLLLAYALLGMGNRFKALSQSPKSCPH